MGKTLLVVLLLLFLGGVAVKPRTQAVRTGVLMFFGTLFTALGILVYLGHVPWNWPRL